MSPKSKLFIHKYYRTKIYTLLKILKEKIKRWVIIAGVLLSCVITLLLFVPIWTHTHQAFFDFMFSLLSGFYFRRDECWDIALAETIYFSAAIWWCTNMLYILLWKLGALRRCRKILTYTLLLMLITLIFIHSFA